MKSKLKIETLEELQNKPERKDPDEFVCMCGSPLVGAVAIVDMNGNVLVQFDEYVCLEDQKAQLEPDKILRVPRINERYLNGLHRRWTQQEGKLSLAERPMINAGHKST